jgi:hypothetical protein
VVVDVPDVAVGDAGSAVLSVASGVGTTVFGAGSLRMDGGTSRRGARRATIFSTSAFLFPRADWSTASWLWGVRCGASNRTVVRFMLPSRSIWRIPGKRRAARALRCGCRLVLRETERVEAVREERRVAGPQVNVAGVELGEVGDEVGRGGSLPSSEALHARQELRVGQTTQGIENVVLHACFYHVG